MKKLLLCLLPIVITIFYSCENKRSYECILLVQEKYLGNKIVQKPPKVIEAMTDSAAYLKAYEWFIIAKETSELVSENIGQEYDSPIAFKLISPEGKDIAESISFYKKDELEEKIRTSLTRSIKQDNHPSESDNTNNIIPGLHPVDVYVSFEKKGFTVSKNFSKEYGNTWTCDYKKGDRDFRVEIFGNTTKEISLIKASLIRSSRTKEIDDVEFLKFTASAPYDGASPLKAKKWVEENFDRDGAETTIAGVKFKIFAKTEFSRLLVISNKQINL